MPSKHWDECYIIGEFLEVPKTTVHNLWNTFKKQNLIKPLLLRAEEAKVLAKKLIVDAVEQKELFKEPIMSRKHLNMALWYIEQIDDIDEAERVMAAAIQSCRFYRKTVQ